MQMNKNKHITALLPKKLIFFLTINKNQTIINPKTNTKELNAKK